MDEIWSTLALRPGCPRPPHVYPLPRCLPPPFLIPTSHPGTYDEIRSHLDGCGQAQGLDRVQREREGYAAEPSAQPPSSRGARPAQPAGATVASGAPVAASPCGGGGVGREDAAPPSFQPGREGEMQGPGAVQQPCGNSSGGAGRLAESQLEEYFGKEVSQVVGRVRSGCGQNVWMRCGNVWVHFLSLNWAKTLGLPFISPQGCLYGCKLMSCCPPLHMQIKWGRRHARAAAAAGEDAERRRREGGGGPLPVAGADVRREAVAGDGGAGNKKDDGMRPFVCRECGFEGLMTPVQVLQHRRGHATLSAA